MSKVPDSVVVVGGGLAGYTLVDALRREGGSDGRLTIIDREPALYDRPPLSKAAFLTDAGLADLEFAAPDRLAERGIEVITGRTVVAIDRGVVLDDGRRFVSDAVVLATGGQARRLAFQGQDAPIVHTLRTFDDVRRIRANVRAGGRTLIVGAGLIGAELTSALRALGVEVTLIDPVELPLVGAAGEAIARRLHGMHADREVDVRVATLTELLGGPDAWTAVLSDGSQIPVDAVVVGIGLVPEVDLAVAAGLEVDDGVVVDARHRAAEGIYAIGDVARIRDDDGTIRRRAEHWEAARLDALELAEVLLGRDPAPRGAGWWWSDRYGVHVEGVGRMTGPGSTVLRGEHAALHLDGDRLVGAISIDDPNLVRAARRIIDQRLPIRAADLADPAVSLRAMLKAPR